MISLATRCHSRSLVVPSTTVCPSRVGNAPYGATAGELDAERLLVDAGVLGVGQLVAHHVGHHVEQAHPDGGCGTFGAGPGENSSARIDSAAYSPVVKSAMAGPGLAGMPGIPGDRARPALGLHQQVVGALVRDRPAGSVAVDLDGDHVGVPHGEVVGRKAHPRGRSRREVGHQRVGAVEQPVQHVHARGGLQVQRDRFLAAVAPDEVGGKATRPLTTSS